MIWSIPRLLDRLASRRLIAIHRGNAERERAASHAKTLAVARDIRRDATPLPPSPALAA